MSDAGTRETIEERWHRMGPPQRLLVPPPPPPTREEVEALVAGVVAAGKQWLESGRLVKLGPRRYRYNLVSLREEDE